MRRFSASVFGLLGLALVLLSPGGCGQNEGGRCQINSDCASGLQCRGGESGNGVCESVNTPGPVADAATLADGGPDLSLAPGPETAAPSDGEPSEAGMSPTPVDAEPTEAAAIDTQGID
jgi:hypothetical protein